MKKNISQNYCTNCGEQLENDERFCSQCGQEKGLESFSRSKKENYIVIGVAIFVVIIMGIISIGNKEEKNLSSEMSSDVFSKVPIINQDVRVGDVRWKLIDAKDRGNILRVSEAESSFFAEDKTTIGKFIEITIEVENLGKDIKSVMGLNLVGDQDREFTSASDVDDWIPDEKELFLLDNLNPNMPIQFTQIFEIPIDATGLMVKVGDLSIWGKEEAFIKLGL